MKNELIPKQIIDMLQTRMANEYMTSFHYQSMRAYFERMNLNGFADYFRQEAERELEHAHMIIQYLADKQADYIIPAIDYVPDAFSDLSELMQQYVDFEQQTTDDLYAIDDMTQQLKDHATHSWLNASRKGQDFALIPYQDEELKSAYDLQAEVMRVLGRDPQMQGIGLNAIDFGLQD